VRPVPAVVIFSSLLGYGGTRAPRPSYCADEVFLIRSCGSELTGSAHREVLNVHGEAVSIIVTGIILVLIMGNVVWQNGANLLLVNSSTGCDVATLSEAYGHVRADGWERGGR